MGRKSLEKTIEKRLNKERNIKTKSVNETIKKKREEEGYSLSNVSEGICCPSYLYKFEKGDVEPNSEIVEMICEKFDVEYMSLDEAIDLNDKIIERFNKNLYEKNKEELDEFTKELEKQKYKYSSLDVDIAILKCAVIKQDKELFKEYCIFLSNHESDMSNIQFANYLHAVAINEISNCKYNEALNILKKISWVNKFSGDLNFQKLINFQLASCYIQLGQFISGQKHANECYYDFLEDNNFYRAMESKMLVLIALSETNSNKQIIQNFTSFIDSLKKIGYSSLTQMAIHNFCNILHYKRYHLDVCEYTINYMKDVNEQTSEVLKMLYIINSTDYLESEEGILDEKAIKEIIDKCKQFMSTVNSTNLSIEGQFWKEFAKYKLENNPQALKKHIIKNIIKVFKQPEDSRTYKYLYYTLSQIFISESRYKDAIRYFNKICEEFIYNK